MRRDKNYLRRIKPSETMGNNRENLRKIIALRKSRILWLPVSFIRFLFLCLSKVFKSNYVAIENHKKRQHKYGLYFYAINRQRKKTKKHFQIGKIKTNKTHAHSKWGTKANSTKITQNPKKKKLHIYK